MIYELPNFINIEQLNYINKELQSVVNINPNICQYKPSFYRDGETISISDEASLKNLDSFLFKEIFGSKLLLEFIQCRYGPKEKTGDTGYEFHSYKPGDLCNVHSDGELTFVRGRENEGSMLRFASIVLHLNTPSTGGELIFPTLNKTIKTEAGKLVIFPPYGFVQHYTTKSPDMRNVIITWFVYKNILVQKINGACVFK